MSRKANPTLIGAFVLAAAVLPLVALLLLGLGDLWRDKQRAVLYFEGSVRGLNVGSSVVFRGVQVGRVVDIKLYVDAQTGEALIPVVVEFTPGVVLPSRRSQEALDPEDALALLIEQGLKGRLETQSLLTGLLMVELDILAEEPARLVGFDQRYQEIPTVPTVLQQISKQLEKVDIGKMADDLQGILDGLNRAVDSPHVRDSLQLVEQTLASYKRLAERVEEELGTLAGEYRTLAQRVGERVEPTANGIDTLLQESSAAIVAARETIELIDRHLVEEGGLLSSLDRAADATGDAASSAGALLREDSYLLLELHTALRELGAAAQSLRLLAQTLERKPEALLRGK
jgi:paraquat-inducible protein B